MKNMCVKSRMKRIVSALLCAAVVAALTLPMTGCGEQKKYDAAAALAESGDWESARAGFEELAALGYEDSADRVTACDYAIAKETMDAEDYEKAEELFGELGDYEDSAELVTQCRYLRAKGLYEAESYEEADAIFSEMKDYEDCRRLSMICRMRYDISGYLDELVTTVNNAFRKEELPFSLVRGEDYNNEFGHRFYYVMPDGLQPGDKNAPDVYVSFVCSDGKGTEHSRGQVNTFMVVGDLEKFNEKNFEDMFTVFLSAAIILKGAAAESEDYEAMADSFNEDYQKLLAEVEAPGWSSSDGEFEGFETRTSLSIFEGNYIRCFYSMYIPELADE